MKLAPSTAPLAEFLAGDGRALDKPALAKAIAERFPNLTRTEFNEALTLAGKLIAKRAPEAKPETSKSRNRRRVRQRMRKKRGRGLWGMQ